MVTVVENENMSLLSFILTIINSAQKVWNYADMINSIGGLVLYCPCI